jgi:hypothetical protein
VSSLFSALPSIGEAGNLTPSCGVDDNQPE